MLSSPRDHNARSDNDVNVSNNPPDVVKTTDSNLNLNNLSSELLPQLNDHQKVGLVQLLLKQLPPSTADQIVSQRLATMSADRLYRVADRLPDKVTIL